jgi:hypothetical protein
MLPAWAAVAIALGASAVGALAGIFGAYISLRVTQLNLHHEAAEAWRTRQLEAAEDFSVEWTATLSFVGLVRAATATGEDPSRPLDLLQQKHADAGSKLMRVGLLFGADSTARGFARDALSALNHASAALEDLRDDRDEAIRQCNDHLARAQSAHRDFVRVAHTELRTLRTSRPSADPKLPRRMLRLRRPRPVDKEPLSGAASGSPAPD